MRRALCCRLVLAGVIASPSPSPADGGQLGKLVGKVVRSRYGELHACYRRALARDRRRGGTVFIKVTLGGDDKVAAAKVARDELCDKAVARCLEAKVARWRFPGAAAAGAVGGSVLYVPLTFRADPGQQAIAAADLGWPLSSSVALLTAQNCGIGGVSVKLSRVQTVQESHLSRARLLVLVKGRAALGRRRRSAPSVVLLPPGSDVELEPRASRRAARRTAGRLRRRVDVLVLELPGELAGKATPQLWGLGPRLRTLAPGIAARVVTLKPNATLTQGDVAARRVLFVLAGFARLRRGGKTASGRQVGPSTGVYWSKRGRSSLVAERTTRLIEIRLP